MVSIHWVVNEHILIKHFPQVETFFPQTVYCGVLSYGKKGCPRCALAAFLELVRHVSASCPLWPRPQTLSGICPPSGPPCVCFGRASKPCPSPPYVWFGFPSKPWPPCVGQAFCPPRLVSALCRLWPRLPALCLQSCPLCLPCVRSLSFLCSLVVRSLFGFWPGLWFGFDRAFVSSLSVLWFLRLCLFCVRCCPP